MRTLRSPRHPAFQTQLPAAPLPGIPTMVRARRTLSRAGSAAAPSNTHPSPPHPPALPLAPHDALVARLRASPRQREAVLRQFLRARAYDPAAAAQMMRAALAWRQRIGVARFLRDAPALVRDPRAGFPMRRVTSGGPGVRDMVVYGVLRLMDKNVVEKDRFLDATTAWLEDVYADTEYEAEPINAILDFGGWSLRKHTPYASAKAGITLLNDYYPERLGKVFCVRYPSSIRVAYNVIRPLLDAGAREKIIFVDSADPATILRQHLAEESLPVFCGGKLHVDFGPSIDLEKEWREDAVAGVATSASGALSYFTS